jgi:hypothetical protein
MTDTRNYELYYANRPVADLTVLKAIDTTLAVDAITVSVSSLGIWKFVRASVAVADDLNIVQPTVGVGRWFRQTMPAFKIDGSGFIDNSVLPTTLKNGTLATTQSAADNSTKLATTAYVDNAVGSENLWDRDVTNSALYPHNTGDMIAGVTTASGNLTLTSTSHATKGKINLGSVGTSFFTETTEILTLNNLTVSSLIGASAGKELVTITALPNGTTATTQTSTDNSTKVATTAFVQSAITGGVNAVTNAYTPTLGQTVFTLTQTRSTDFHFILTLNGQVREETVDFTVSGTTLTWLDPAGLTLVTTDRLIARYYY